MRTFEREGRQLSVHPGVAGGELPRVIGLASSGAAKPSIPK